MKEDGQEVVLLKVGWHKTSEVISRLAALRIPAGAASVVPRGREAPAPRLRPTAPRLRPDCARLLQTAPDCAQTVPRLLGPNPRAPQEALGNQGNSSPSDWQDLMSSRETGSHTLPLEEQVLYRGQH